MKQILLSILLLCVLLSSSACGAAVEDALAAEMGNADTENGSAYDFGVSGETPDDLIPATVTRVVDGDTLEILLDGETEKLRLIGIDTPESVHPDAEKNVPYGEIASDFTENALLDQDIGLEFDAEERDRYGRLLAYVYVDGDMFNKILLDEGHAMVSTYPPNVKYVELFTQAQIAAREAGKGLWGIDSGLGLGAAASPSANPDASYIGTIASYKFHTRDCTWGQKISESNAVYFDTPGEAVAAGFTPCKVCNP